MKRIKDKWFAIVNPIAGYGRALDDLPTISKLLRDHNVDYELVFTEHKYHATQLTVEAVRRGYRKIIVMGGDGTLHEVINGIFIQQEVATDQVLVAVIAVGTGNDWIRMYGIPRKYSEAINAIVESHSFLQDVGVVKYEEASYRQQRYMSNAGGIGLDATVVQRFNRLKAKGYRGRRLYVYGLVKSYMRYTSTGMRIWVDDQLVVNDIVLSATIGICKYNGGGMMQVPQAVSDDGLLDLTTIRKIHWWQIPANFRRLFNGNIYSIPQVSLHRGSKIRIESTPDAPIEIDGELVGNSPVEFTILHRAVRVVVSEKFLRGELMKRPGLAPEINMRTMLPDTK